MRRVTPTTRLPIVVAVLMANAFVAIVPSGCSADCDWHATVQAFVDKNANGTWETDEPPLQGAEFHVKDTNGNSYYTQESDNTGLGHIDFFISCNGTSEFVVFAKPPQGYQLTTPDHIDAGSDSGKTFTFGFAKK